MMMPPRSSASTLGSTRSICSAESTASTTTQAFSEHLDVGGMDPVIVTKTRDALEHRRAGESFVAKQFEDAPEQGAVIVHTRLAENDPEQHLLAFDAPHIVPPKDRDPCGQS
jgi:hypothetical protein